MQIIGHRGARKEAPENTLGGFKYIAKLGLQAVEFDVRALADHTLVVSHDDNLLRTSGYAVDLLDKNVQLHHLLGYSQTQHWPAWPMHEPLPALAQVWPLFNGFSHIELELKAVPSAVQATTLAHLVMAELNLLPVRLRNAVTVTSFDERILASLRQLYPQQALGLLVESGGKFTLNPALIVPTALKYGCKRVGLKDQLASKALVHDVLAAGLGCSVWTVNDPARAQTLQQYGVTGLITDVPAAMLAAGIGHV